jgi:cysteine synthase
MNNPRGRHIKEGNGIHWTYFRKHRSGLVPAIYNPSQIDITIMVETEIAYETTRQIIRREGIFVGVSSGAAMYAAAQPAVQ